MSWEILFFESGRDEKPVEIFIDSLDIDTEAKVFRMVYTLLHQYGPSLTMPHSKKITDNLYELRIRGKVEIRIFYTFKDKAIYLLHAFQKKSQKIPSRELDIAKKRLAYYHRP